MKNIKTTINLTIVFILATVVVATPIALASPSYTWTAVGTNIPQLPATSYLSGSSDAKYDITVGFDGVRVAPYISSDYGNTWVEDTTLTQQPSFASMSDSGQYIIAAVGGGDLYLSSDYGTSWTALAAAGSQNWESVAVSSNGQYILATTATNQAYVSHDAGTSWSTPTLAGSSFNVPTAMSASGQYMYIGDEASGGSLYVSNNYGVTWSPEGPNVSPNAWVNIETSSTGQYAVASDLDSTVYITNNYGQTWTASTVTGGAATGGIFRGAAISSNGQDIVTADLIGSQNYAFESFDGGATWQTDSNLGNGTSGWRNIVASADFSHIVLLGPGGIMAGQEIVAPNPNPPSSQSSKQGTSAVPSSPDTGFGAPHSTGSLLYSMIASAFVLTIGGLSVRKRATNSSAKSDA